jgi:hypothetical protein
MEDASAWSAVLAEDTGDAFSFFFFQKLSEIEGPFLGQPVLRWILPALRLGSRRACRFLPFLVLFAFFLKSLAAGAFRLPDEVIQLRLRFFREGEYFLRSPAGLAETKEFRRFNPLGRHVVSDLLKKGRSTGRLGGYFPDLRECKGVFGHWILVACTFAVIIHVFSS